MGWRGRQHELRYFHPSGRNERGVDGEPRELACACQALEERFTHDRLSGLEGDNGIRRVPRWIRARHLELTGKARELADKTY